MSIGLILGIAFQLLTIPLSIGIIVFPHIKNVFGHEGDDPVDIAKIRKTNPATKQSGGKRAKRYAVQHIIYKNMR